MASKEFIEKRIEGKKKELDKLTKKLERIRKVEAQGWQDPNPYYYHESDLRYTLRDIEEAKAALAKYEAQLAEEIKKEGSRNVPAILEFLENWKRRVTNFYDVGFTAYFKESARIAELSKRRNETDYGTPEREAAEKELSAARKAIRAKLRGYYRDLTPEEKKQPRFRYMHEIKVKDGEWEHLNHYLESTYEETLAKLQKDLDEEAKRKYDFIIERTVAIVGTITDATYLEVGASGELNGFIKGTDGTANVNTIGAGGYNIQCYHFRTLIKRKA